MATRTSASRIEIRTDLGDEQVDRYQREGWLLIPGALEREVARSLRDEVMDLMGIIGLPLTNLRQTAEYLGGGWLDALVNHPRLNAIAARLLGGPAHQFTSFTAVKSPGGGRFSFHQDNQYTRHDGPSVNLWFAFEEMSEDNGCLRMLPRSHRSGTLAPVAVDDGTGHLRVPTEPTDFVPVPMQPGDCIAFTRLTVHGSGANTSDRPRVGYAVLFHREDTRWLDDGEWKLLREQPKYRVGPVAEITRPTSKIDGH